MRNSNLLFVVLAGALLACGGGGSTPTGTTGGTGLTGGTGGTGGTGTTAGSTTNQISVLDSQFSPSATTVTPTTTITWTWNTPIVHNITFSDATLGGSGDKSSGTYTKTFPTAGAFAYVCTNHPGMGGTITVK